MEYSRKIKLAEKQCSSCGVIKPTSQFWKRRDAKDGYRGMCRTCLDAYFRKYRSNHLDKRRWIERKCYYKHQEKYNKSNQERKYKDKILALTYYGSGVCACVNCGFSDVRALSIDHITGGGKAHERERHGTAISTWLKTRGFPSGYQTLCMNCQFIKKIENKEQIQ